MVKVVGGNRVTFYINSSLEVEYFGNISSYNLPYYTSSNDKTQGVIETLSGIISISCGSSHFTCVDEEGNIWVCGRLFNSLLDNKYDKLFKIENLKESMIDVTSGSNFIVCLSTQGNIYVAGKNDNQQLGILNYSKGLIHIPFLEQIESISTGDLHTICISFNGDLYSFGDNHFGQLGQGNTDIYIKPIQINNIPFIKYVSCGNNYSICIDINGELWAFGENTYGQLGLGDNQHRFSPVKIPNISNIALYVSCGNNHTMIIDENHNLWCFGNNKAGQLGIGTYISLPFPQEVYFIKDIINLSHKGDILIFSDIEGKIYCCGGNNNGELGIMSKFQNTPTRLTRMDYCIWYSKSRQKSARK